MLEHFFQAIDCSSPKSLSETFISAWRSHDYITFYSLLDAETQSELINNTFNHYNIQNFFLGDPALIARDLYPKKDSRRLTAEHAANSVVFIDDLFIAAEKIMRYLLL